MTNTQGRTFGQSLNTWVQTIAFLLAAILGVYTFWYKDVLLPKSAPVNISMNLELERIGDVVSADQNEPLVAVQMRVTARNPSPREVHLLRSAWIAYGETIDASSDANSFEQNIELFNSEILYPTLQRHSMIDNWSVVAFGELFTDTVLRPDETVMRTTIIYVPVGEYDLIEVNTIMPTVEELGEVELVWSLDEALGLGCTIYRLNSSGQRGEEIMDCADPDPDLEFQTAMSMSALSLW